MKTGASGELALFAAWAVALIATLSVLFIGEVLGQTPCILCWYQRAFMFPLAVILGIAAWRADFTIRIYALPLAIIGAGIALWHLGLFIGLIPEAIQPCTTDGPSCTDENQLFLGMPIPLLSLAAFSAIIFLLMAAQPESDK
ncbi:disulfide bond formation protein B [Sedimentitalea sp. XS_ASV28]|uniref:disulfide bond formation protein B n=1 Tax=Sedimentitalea sp. XS_ASV28 TaxID=3241296 RepID=UPI003510F480